jgi:6-phosphogluconolactonase
MNKKGMLPLIFDFPPFINCARHVLWLVTGAEKAEMLARLVAGDNTSPAGRIDRERAVVFADREAASQLQ